MQTYMCPYFHEAISATRGRIKVQLGETEVSQPIRPVPAIPSLESEAICKENKDEERCIISTRVLPRQVSFSLADVILLVRSSWEFQVLLDFEWKFSYFHPHLITVHILCFLRVVRISETCIYSLGI